MGNNLVSGSIFGLTVFLIWPFKLKDCDGFESTSSNESYLCREFTRCKRITHDPAVYLHWISENLTTLSRPFDHHITVAFTMYISG